MSDCHFPSGQWFGFYTYAGRSRRYLMDLLLEFNNGAVSGEGADGIGLFIISGAYSASSGECSWVKQYVGRHAVNYRGFREAKGIWGTWHLEQTKGGFHIWPLAEGEPLTVTQAEEETRKTSYAPARTACILPTIRLPLSGCFSPNQSKPRNFDRLALQGTA